MPDEPFRTTTVRLPEPMASDAALVARVDGVSLSYLITTAVEAHIEQRRNDAEFQARLRERIAADQKILDRISGAS